MRTRTRDERPPPTLLANTGALVGSRLVVAALGWAGTVFIVRSLSVDEWGRFSFVFNLLGLLAIVTSVVNGRVAIRGIVEDPDPERYAGTYVVLRSALGLLGYCVAVSFVVLGGYPEEVVRATAVAGVVVIIASSSAALEAVFQVHGRMAPVARSYVAGQLAQFALTAILAFVGTSMVVFTVPAVLCEVVIIAWKLRAQRPLMRMRPSIVWPAWKQMLREALPLAVGGGLATMYYSLDSVMLSKLDTFSAVGIYGIAYKFAGVVQFVPAALTAALLAPLVTSWPSQPERFWAAFRRGSVLLLIVAGLVAAEFLLFSEPVIGLLYGSEYEAAAGATRLVMAAECVGFFTALGLTALIAMGRKVLYPIAALVGLAINLGVNLVVIPRYSFRGAAWATLVTEVVVVTILWVPLLRTRGRASLPLQAAAKVVCASIASGLIGWLLMTVAPWPVAGSAVALVYLGGVHLTRAPGPGGLVSLLREAELNDPPAAGRPASSA